jgi:hypothetical protein
MQTLVADLWKWTKVFVAGCVLGGAGGWALGTLIHALSGW